MISVDGNKLTIKGYTQDLKLKDAFTARVDKPVYFQNIDVKDSYTFKMTLYPRTQTLIIDGAIGSSSLRSNILLSQLMSIDAEKIEVLFEFGAVITSTHTITATLTADMNLSADISTSQYINALLTAMSEIGIILLTSDREVFIDKDGKQIILQEVEG